MVGNIDVTFVLRSKGTLVCNSSSSVLFLNRTFPSLLHTFVVDILLNFPLPFKIPVILSYTNTSRVNTFGRLLVFSGFHRIIDLKTSKHEFADIIHQNKKEFEGKKLSEGQAGRNSLRFNNMCSTLRRIGDRHARFKLFSYLDFRVCFACYPPESFKIICLTCVWLKFIDTSFHSRQKHPQITSNFGRHCYSFLKNRCVKLKTPRGLELGT